MADAEDAVGRDRLQVQFDLGEEGERAFRADQKLRHVVAGIVDHVDVVAADPAQQFRETRSDLVGLAAMQRAHRAHQIAIALRPDIRAEIAGHRGEMRRRAVGEDGVDGVHIVHHVAVAQRARAAAIVGGHAADGGAAAGRDVDREEQALGLERFVEPFEHHAGLDPDAAPGDVKRAHRGHVLAAIDDQGAADGLAALRRAAAARQHRHALLAGDREHRVDVVDVARHHDAQRLDLEIGGVGAVAAAREGVEQHLALDRGFEPRRQRRIARTRRHAPAP